MCKGDEMGKYFFLFVSFALISACTTGVHRVNNTSSGKAIFVSECSPNNYTLCQKRAAQKCTKGYSTLKRYTDVKDISEPIYRTYYRTRYRYYYHHGHRHYRPYTERYSRVVGYRHYKRPVQYLRFSCR